MSANTVEIAQTVRTFFLTRHMKSLNDQPTERLFIWKFDEVGIVFLLLFWRVESRDAVNVSDQTAQFARALN